MRVFFIGYLYPKPSNKPGPMSEGYRSIQGVEDDYCDIQELKHTEAPSQIGANAVMYPEGGYFNSALQSEEDYVKNV